MFFPERVKSVDPDDYVLEIGPGGTPHPRSDIFLELRFDDPAVAAGQRGFAPPLKTTKEIVFYDGGRFPFHDKEFDYIICSHVLEHVDDVDAFVSEIVRVGKKGYLEYPTVYYDYIYNFPEHITLLFHRNNVLYWMPKAETGLNTFHYIQRFFYESLRKGYKDIVQELKCFLFQGFEWEECVISKRISSLEQLGYAPEEFELLVKPKKIPSQKTEKGLLQNLAGSFYRLLK